MHARAGLTSRPPAASLGCNLAHQTVMHDTLRHVSGCSMLRQCKAWPQTRSASTCVLPPPQAARGPADQNTSSTSRSTGRPIKQPSGSQDRSKQTAQQQQQQQQQQQPPPKQSQEPAHKQQLQAPPSAKARMLQNVLQSRNEHLDLALQQCNARCMELESDAAATKALLKCAQAAKSALDAQCMEAEAATAVAEDKLDAAKAEAAAMGVRAKQAEATAAALAWCLYTAAMQARTWEAVYHETQAGAAAASSAKEAQQMLREQQHQQLLWLMCHEAEQRESREQHLRDQLQQSQRQCEGYEQQLHECQPESQQEQQQQQEQQDWQWHQQKQRAVAMQQKLQEAKVQVEQQLQKQQDKARSQLQHKQNELQVVERRLWHEQQAHVHTKQQLLSMQQDLVRAQQQCREQQQLAEQHRQEATALAAKLKAAELDKEDLQVQIAVLMSNLELVNQQRSHNTGSALAAGDAQQHTAAAAEQHSQEAAALAAEPQAAELDNDSRQAQQSKVLEGGLAQLRRHSHQAARMALAAAIPATACDHGPAAAVAPAADQENDASQPAVWRSSTGRKELAAADGPAGSYAPGASASFPSGSYPLGLGLTDLKRAVDAFSAQLQHTLTQMDHTHPGMSSCLALACIDTVAQCDGYQADADAIQQQVLQGNGAVVQGLVGHALLQLVADACWQVPLVQQVVGGEGVGQLERRLQGDREAQRLLAQLVEEKLAPLLHKLAADAVEVLQSAACATDGNQQLKLQQLATASMMGQSAVAEQLLQLPACSDAVKGQQLSVEQLQQIKGSSFIQQPHGSSRSSNGCSMSGRSNSGRSNSGSSSSAGSSTSSEQAHGSFEHNLGAGPLGKQLPGCPIEQPLSLEQLLVKDTAALRMLARLRQRCDVLEKRQQLHQDQLKAHCGGQQQQQPPAAQQSEQWQEAQQGQWQVGQQEQQSEQHDEVQLATVASSNGNQVATHAPQPTAQSPVATMARVLQHSTNRAASGIARTVMSTAPQHSQPSRTEHSNISTTDTLEDQLLLEQVLWPLAQQAIQLRLMVAAAHPQLQLEVSPLLQPVTAVGGSGACDVVVVNHQRVLLECADGSATGGGFDSICSGPINKLLQGLQWLVKSLQKATSKLAGSNSSSAQTAQAETSGVSSCGGAVSNVGNGAGGVDAAADGEETLQCMLYCMAPAVVQRMVKVAAEVGTYISYTQ